MLAVCVVDAHDLAHLVSLVVAAVNSGDCTPLRYFERSRRIALARDRDEARAPLDVAKTTDLLGRLRRVDEPERRDDGRIRALLDVMNSFSLQGRQVSAYAVDRLEWFVSDLEDALSEPVTSDWRERCLRELAEDACRALAALDGFDYERREPATPDHALVDDALEGLRAAGALPTLQIFGPKASILEGPPVFPPMDRNGPGWSKLFTAGETPPRVASGLALRALLERIPQPETIAQGSLPTAAERKRTGDLLTYRRMCSEAERKGLSIVEYGG